MKLYENIEDIIAHAAEFHGKLSRFYQDLTDKVEKERVAMMLEYLSRHEQRLQKGLERYRAPNQGKPDHTWLQYVPGVERLSLQDLEPSPDMGVDDLVEMVMEMDDRLLSFYREIADKGTIPPEARELFKQLAEQEEQEKANLVRTAEQIKNT